MFHCELQEILNELNDSEFIKLVLFVLLQTLSLELNMELLMVGGALVSEVYTAESVSLFEQHNISY